MDSNTKKSAQLGMNHGTATHHLRKRIILRLLQRLGEDLCFRCGNHFKSADDLSIEHKVPWLDSDPTLF